MSTSELCGSNFVLEGGLITIRSFDDPVYLSWAESDVEGYYSCLTCVIDADSDTFVATGL